MKWGWGDLWLLASALRSCARGLDAHAHLEVGHTCLHCGPLGPGPLSTHIPSMFSPPPARAGYQLFPEAQGHHQPDPKPAVPRDSWVSAAAMLESWLCAPEAKVPEPLAGWWE